MVSLLLPPEGLPLALLRPQAAVQLLHLPLPLGVSVLTDGPIKASGSSTLQKHDS